MPRRVSLPGASELFRPTQPAESVDLSEEPELDATSASEDRPAGGVGGRPPTRPDATSASEDRPAGGVGVRPPTRQGSGRVRHEEKITVYVSSDELLNLEQARLTLRARHGLAVDRGRIVREAILLALDELEADGADSELVRRLSVT